MTAGKTDSIGKTTEPILPDSVQSGGSLIPRSALIIALSIQLKCPIVGSRDPIVDEGARDPGRENMVPVVVYSK